VGRIKGISRPALCPVLPTLIDGKSTLLIDCGANVDCKPINLCHFAIMGSSYATAAFGVENPVVSLLSNGTEDKKGNELNHQTFPLLKSMDCINFSGNIEAREMLAGETDVIVTDGFAGNIALKGIEGAINSVLKMLKKGIMSSISGKIGGMFLKPVFKDLKKKLDYNNNGGAVFIGLEKIVVKSHGSSKAQSIACSIMQVKNAAEHNLIENIKNKLSTVDLTELNKEQ
jgi:glycerol-3-phosphate acyltransferase PlsX